MNQTLTKYQELSDKYSAQFRDPTQIIRQDQEGGRVDTKLLKFEATKGWWNLLDSLKKRLIVSREYEHLLLALGSEKNSPQISFLSLPHPSGIAVDNQSNKIYIASTRNPNQIYTFSPVSKYFVRDDIKGNGKAGSKDAASGVLVPEQVNFYPGSLYLHDLTFVGKKLYANAVGHNTIVQLDLKENGKYKYAWWPLCVDQKGKPKTNTNYLQLNSIAAGSNIRNSFFTASTNEVSSRRPGHRNFSVDGKGVIFSGATRKPICEGLTRPHSARLYQNKIWLNNSGYGEFGFVNNHQFQSIVTLPGWTRGLWIQKGIAFVGTSKVIPRFSQYAPGLKFGKSVCGIFAVELKTGKVLEHIQWKQGNQIFAIEGISSKLTKGFPNEYLPRRENSRLHNLFYAFNRM